MQFSLLSFYRLLPMPAFLTYLGVYYVVFLPLMLGFLLGPLGTLFAPTLLFFFSTLVGVLGLFLGGLEARTDFRSLLAFSTLLNLSLILIYTGAHL